MTEKHTPSINEISLAINSLFLNITEPITFPVNKSNLFKRYKKLYFKIDHRMGFEFSINPIFRFDDAERLHEFLEHEKQLSVRFQDYEGAAELHKLLNEKEGSTDSDNFYLNYTVEITEDEVMVFFNTNSLVFKYEVIGN